MPRIQDFQNRFFQISLHQPIQEKEISEFLRKEISSRQSRESAKTFVLGSILKSFFSSSWLLNFSFQCCSRFNFVASTREDRISFIQFSKNFLAFFYRYSLSH